VATVLFCDDNPRIQRLFVAIFATTDHRVVVAGDAREALAEVERVRPDLVITDNAMPGMSGIELVAELRRRPELASVPLVILSASTEASREEEARAAGATGFLRKPFSPEEMLAAVDSYLAGRRG
jgi:two-component system, chemotaxis family, chemotaxis protein CheY